jgi:hypothetical protein
MTYVVIYEESYTSGSLSGADITEEVIEKFSNKDALAKKILKLKSQNIEFEVYEKIIPSL